LLLPLPSIRYFGLIWKARFGILKRCRRNRGGHGPDVRRQAAFDLFFLSDTKQRSDWHGRFMAIPKADGLRILRACLRRKPISHSLHTYRISQADAQLGGIGRFFEALATKKGSC